MIPIDLINEPKESCTGTRRAETCVAPRRVDASRGVPMITCPFVLFVVRACVLFYFISSAPAACGEGLPDFLSSFFPLFSWPQARVTTV